MFLIWFFLKKNKDKMPIDSIERVVYKCESMNCKVIGEKYFLHSYTDTKMSIVFRRCVVISKVTSWIITTVVCLSRSWFLF